jgi:sugar phosphate isomerase/epimerase
MITDKDAAGEGLGMLNRRDFVSNSGALVLLAGAAPALARARSQRLGIQLWSVAKLLAADFEGTIALLAKLGYSELETYGPYTFSDPRQIASWNAVTPALGFSGSGLFGHSLTSARTLFRSHGLRVPSMHTDLFTLQTRMGELAEAAHGLGATYVTLPSLPPDLRQTLDDYRRAADTFNAIGEQATRHGVRFAYHNHGYGLVPVDGKVPLDTLLAATDPDHVFFELDTYWTIAGGADPKDYLARYKGRYKMVHLKDMQGIHRFAGDGGDPAQWIALFPHMTSLGNGSVDIRGIVEAARKSGVDHYFVEQDRADDVLAAVRGSANYLRTIGFR